MNQILSEAGTLVYALGWTLTHALWQGVLVLLCLRISLKLLPKRAELRYYMNLGALLFLFAWFTATFVQQWQRQAAMARTAPGAAIAASAEGRAGKAVPLISGELHRLEQVFPLMTVVYAVGLAFMLLRAVAGLSALYRLRRHQVLPAEEALTQKMQQLAVQLGLRRPVRLLLSLRVRVPMVIGALRPVVLLPAALATGLSAVQLEAIFLHELTHIRRGDFLLNMLQHIVESLLFFHPAVWLISAAVRHERELCCDDIVVRHARPYDYATALAALEAYRAQTPGTALAASGQPQHLFNRIKRIMETKTQTTGYSRLTAALLIAIAATAMIWATPLTAQPRKDKKNKSTVVEATAPQAPQISSGNRTDSVTARSGTTQPTATVRTRTLPPAVATAPDSVLAVVEDARKIAQEALKNIPTDDIRAAALEAVRQVNADSIARQARKIAREALADSEKGLQHVDWEKISQQIDEAMRQVDWEAINREIRAGLKEVNWEEIREEVRKAVEESK